MNRLDRPAPTLRLTPRLTPLAAALSLALAAFAQPALAAPAMTHWTVTDLGTLGGGESKAYAINNFGQVTGYAYVDGTTAHAFRFSNGRMEDLGGWGGSFSAGYDINASGWVVGFSYTAGNAEYRAFRNKWGTMEPLFAQKAGTGSAAFGINDAGRMTGYDNDTGWGVNLAFVSVNGSKEWLNPVTLGGSNSYGKKINNAGQVVGYSDTQGNATTHAFLYSNGQMRDLGTLGGNNSYAYSINEAGLVTGYARTGDGSYHAFLYGGSMTDLGTLGGSNSVGRDVNAFGQVTGYSGAYDFWGRDTNHAFLYSKGAMIDLNNLYGTNSSGWTLTSAESINDVGQIVGYGTNPNGDTHGYVLSLDATLWESGNGGSWDSAANWSYSVAPNQRTDVFIDPMRSLYITGPTGYAQARTLTIGGDNDYGNNGIATLYLNGGMISVEGNAGQFTTINAKGVLTGDGVLRGAVTNLGTVAAQNLTLPDGLTNHGVVSGSGRLNTNLSNGPTGLVRTGAMQLLELSGTAHSNSGRIEVRSGGELQVSGTLTNGSGGQVLVDGSVARFNSAVSNAAGGRISLNDGTVYFNAGLTNGGQLQATFGEASVFGAVTTSSGGKIILSGNSNTTFYDDVDINSGGELRISTGSTAVFFGQVFQRSGAMFTGAGSKFYEGGLGLGNSPGLGMDSGNVSFGTGNVYAAEIGGTGLGDTAGNGIEFDRYVVAGTLTLGGTLKLLSWNSFVGQAGQSFDLFDWGTLFGQFSSIDAGGFPLAAGARLDYSRLYIDGSISITAVPEPETYAMMLAGLGLVGIAARRRLRFWPSSACAARCPS